MKWERMLAGARALEKGLQVIEQDSAISVNATVRRLLRF